MEYLLIFISAIFVNNIVLSQFLGICPFLGVSKKVDTAIGMGGAIAFVLTLATIITWCVQKYVLDPFGLQYLQTLAFILVIAALVQMVEIILKKVSPALYQALGIFLPLITTNCAVLGVAILVIQKDYNLLESVVYAFSTALGFALALIVFAGIREQQALVRIPKACIKKITPDMVRIPVFIVVIAAFVTILQMLMSAYAPDSINQALGIYIPLIVVNCIILGRAESFAAKNSPIASLFDGIGCGLGFTLGLTILGSAREILGAGSVFGITLLPETTNILMFILPPGAFLTLGYIIAIFNKVKK
jgi:Na+-translocating ferredoxin:NAD+ oxidoreductase subunit A